MLTPPRWGVLIASLFVLSSCGGDEEVPPPDLPADRMLDRAFERPPASGRAEVELVAEAPEVSSDPVRALVEGPFAAGRGPIPSFDLEGEAEAAGFGVDGSVISTGDDAFVVFFGENYRVGRARVAALGPAVEGIEPRDWFGPAQHAGREEVADEDSYRVEGQLDSAALAEDLTALGAAPADLDRLDGGTVEAWVGVDDEQLHRVRLSSDSVDLDVTLSDLGEPQTIEPPPGGGFQPIDDLLARIPGL